MRDGWQRIRLGDAVDVTIGRQRAPKHETGDHVIPYLRAANVKDGRLLLTDVLSMNFQPPEQETYQLLDGDVLVTEGCGSIRELGASAAWHEELLGTVCFQNTLLRLRARPGVTLPGFVEVWARWAHTSGIWAAHASGTNIFHIGATRAREIELDLPPLAEQQRIVDLVGTASIVEVLTHQALTAARQTVDALRQDAIEAPAYRVVRLQEIIKGIDGGQSPVTEGRTPQGDEPRVLKLSAVKAGAFDPFESKALGAALGLMADRSLVKVGDVLITRSNTPATVGNVCYVDSVPPNTYLSDLILRIHPTDAIDPAFLAEALITKRAREMITASASGTSGSMKKISRKTISDYVVPHPALEVQRRIAELLGAASTVVRTLERRWDALRSVRAAVVRDLLSGEHEIPISYDDLVMAAP